MEYTMRQRAKNIVIYILCSLMFVIAGTTLIREKSFHDEYRYLTIGGDAASYIAMAEGTGEKTPAPFRYRLFFPALASLFDLPAITAFRWITIISLFFFYLIGFLLCELRRCTLTATIMSMIFVFLSPWHLYMYQNPFITDGLVQFTIMVLLFSVVQKNIWLFSIAAFAGIFLHERILFFLPLWWIVHDGKRGSVVVAAAGVMYVGIRMMIGETTGLQAGYPISEFSILAKPLEMIKDAVVGSLPLYLIALTGILFLGEHEKKFVLPVFLIFLAASVLPALVANDTGRMLLGMASLSVLTGVSFFEKVRSAWQGVALLGTGLIMSAAYLPVTFIPISEWLFYRKYFIAIFFLFFLLIYGMILTGNFDRFRKHSAAS
jgi:hypothetical protein